MLIFMEGITIQIHEREKTRFLTKLSFCRRIYKIHVANTVPSIEESVYVCADAAPVPALIFVPLYLA
jgi:hypothetical protein